MVCVKGRMMKEFIRVLISSKMNDSFYDLLQSYYNNKNENDIQRKLAIFMFYALENQKQDYWVEIRKLANSQNKKEKLIGYLLYAGQPNKKDCIYLNFWTDLLNCLKECEVINQITLDKILDKITKIFQDEKEY